MPRATQQKGSSVSGLVPLTCSLRVHTPASWHICFVSLPFASREDSSFSSSKDQNLELVSGARWYPRPKSRRGLLEKGMSVLTPEGCHGASHVSAERERASGGNEGVSSEVGLRLARSGRNE